MSFLINVGKPGSFGGGVSGGASSSIDSDAQAWIDAMTTAPNATYEAAYDNFVKDLKTGPTHGTNVWTALDAVWVLAAHAAQAAHLNAKDPTGTALTPVNSPTFTAGQGYTGDGVSAYLDTGFVPSTSGVNYTLNNASLGAYVRTVGGSGNEAYIGAHNDPSSGRTMIYRIADGGGWVCAGPNSNTFQQGTTLSENAAGLLAGNRSASNAVQIYRNGAQEKASTDASGTLASISFYLLALNWRSTGLTAVTTGQVSLAFVGGSLTANQHADLDAAVDNLKTAIGF